MRFLISGLLVSGMACLPEAPRDRDGDHYVPPVDCDDRDADIHPNADEAWYDGVDGNCDGLSDFDADGDGYDSVDYEGDDCDDADASTHPGGREVAGDGIDQNCDGMDPCADMDCDGWPDVLLLNAHNQANYDTAYSSIYYGSETGFDGARSIQLSTYAARHVAVGHLDDNVYPDLAIVPFSNGVEFQSGVHLYYGAADEPREPVFLEGQTSSDVAIGDLDSDGYSDIVVANFVNPETGSYEVDSRIYWGSPNGIVPTGPSTPLPGLTASDVLLSDIDRDGLLDIVLCGGAGESITSRPASIYWGTGLRKFPLRTDFGNLLCRGVAAGDLNHDGYVDIALAQYLGPSNDLYSPVYLGPDFEEAIWLPSERAHGVAIEDLDGDGWEDLVIIAYRDSVDAFDLNSSIYWGSAEGLSPGVRTLFATQGAHALDVADVNLDGHVDMLVANHHSLASGAGNWTINSHIYYGPLSRDGIGTPVGLLGTGTTDIVAIGP